MKRMRLLPLLLAALPVAHAEDAPRTLAVALLVSRDGALVVGSAPKARPWVATAPGTARPAGVLELELSLLSPRGVLAETRVERPGLCFEHGAEVPPHVAGDRIWVHQDSIVVELPDLPGADAVEVSYRSGAIGTRPRRIAGIASLGPSSASTPGTVHWPEEYGDSDRVAVYGSAEEVGRRINVVVVPDGYTYAEKPRMQADAVALVSWLRGRSPYREHDAFFNYILVYAYSSESGTDQCDCAVVRDTAMRTRFPDLGKGCGHRDHRCIYYGTGNGGPDCDPVTAPVNISAAELRAPAADATIVMVNTARPGGCGGARAVFAASASRDTPAHELGHTVALLDDEYTEHAGCGTVAGEVNTSRNATTGAWPEWTAATGAPRPGAQYWESCIFRPLDDCAMRSLLSPFCPVCKQQWALRIFGHARVSPTAPIASRSPESPVAVAAGRSATFSVTTRLATGTSNEITWLIEGPGLPAGSIAAQGVATLTQTFPAAGSYTLTCRVTADTDLVKPEKNGANVDTVSWIVEAGDGCADCRSADVDGNGNVDGWDLILLSLAFGKSAGDPGFDERADLDDSGAVDGADLAILVAAFGSRP